MKKFTCLLSACLLSVAYGQAFELTNASKAVSLRDQTAKPAPRLRTDVPASTVKASTMRSPEAGEWSEWKDFGEGTLVFTNPVSLSPAVDEFLKDEYTVAMQHRVNAADSDSQQFLLKGLFDGHDIVIDYTESTNALSVAKQATGIVEDGDEYLYTDFATGFSEMDPESLGMTPQELQETVDYYASFNYFIPGTGTFYIFSGIYSEAMGDMVAILDTQIQLDGYSDMTPQIEVDNYLDAAQPKGRIDFDPACDSVKYAIFPGTIQQFMLDAILDGSCEPTSLTEPAEIELKAAPANTVYSIVAISYDGTQPLEYTWSYYTPVAEEAGLWNSLGTSTMVSDFFEPLFGITPQEIEVEVQESIAQPGVYRIVDPYAAYPMKGGVCEDQFHHYITIDASTENVELRNFDMGFDIGAGNFVITSFTDYYRAQGMPEEEISDSGLCGTITDRVITFPKDAFMIWAPDWKAVGGNDGSYYYCNSNGAFSLTIPEGSAVDAVSSATTSAAEYFNLQGVRVSNPQGGMYIRVAGGKSEKVILD